MQAQNVFTALEDVAYHRLDPSDLLADLSYTQVARLLGTNFTDTSEATVLTSGQPRRHGEVSGQLVLDRDLAGQLAGHNVAYVYSVNDGDASHFVALKHCCGFFTPAPSPTAFAPVQAVSEDHPTVVGVRCTRIDDASTRTLRFETPDGAQIEIADQPRRVLRFHTPAGEDIDVAEGDWVSLSGTTGRLYQGRLPERTSSVGRFYELLMETWGSYTTEGEPSGKAARQAELQRLWSLPTVRGFERVKQRAHELADLRVFATAHTPEALVRARMLTGKVDLSEGEVKVDPGHAGPGLLRDERMWATQDQLDLLRLVHLGAGVIGEQQYEQVRSRYLREHGDRLQRVLAASGGGLSIVRTLCMPYAKVFPQGFDPDEFAHRYELDADAVRAVVDLMSGEQEVYHGCRGMRLFSQRPDIAELWLTATLTAARHVIASGIPVRLRLLLATITLPEEARAFVDLFDKIAPAVLGDNLAETIDGISIMIETTGAYLALEDFLAVEGATVRIDGAMIGSNDFTAACLNFNREDAPRTIIPGYLDQGLLQDSPFERLHVPIVGRAILTALRRARRVARDEGHQQLWGFGGELAGDWDTVQWLDANAEPLGMQYVTTAPQNMLPVLFAAAQAAFRQELAGVSDLLPRQIA